MSPWALTIAISFASLEHGLPPGLLAAVVMAESGGRNIVTRERQGGCSVGWAQIYVDDCNGERARRFRGLRENINEGARLLARSRRLCAAHPRWRACRLPTGCAEAFYNAGSRTWCERVHHIWRGLTRGRHPEVPSA